MKYTFQNNDNKRPGKSYLHIRKKVKCLNDNMVFESYSKAAEHYGIQVAQVSRSVIRDQHIRGYLFAAVK